MNFVKAMITIPQITPFLSLFSAYISDWMHMDTIILRVYENEDITQCIVYSNKDVFMCITFYYIISYEWDCFIWMILMIKCLVYCFYSLSGLI